MSDQVDYAGTSAPFSDHEYNVAHMPVATGATGVLPAEHEFVNPGTSVARLNASGGNSLGSFGPHWAIYNSYAGVDIVAQLVVPNDEPVTLGELQTISYSIHRNNMPVRVLGHTSPVGFVKGSRVIAGSMIFTVFNNYAFYRLTHFQRAIQHNLYPIADMLPPFDIVLTFANEYGVFSKMKIYGITIIDEGGTMSIDDILSEGTFSYMARGIQPMTGFSLPEGAPVP